MNIRTTLLRLITLLVLLASAELWASSVLIISIDGMRPDYVTEADKHGLKIPNLRRFLSQGAYAEGVVGVAPTITYPSHTTILTGVWPAQHNIVANLKFDPLFRNYSGWYWYAQDVRTPTLWDVASAAGIVTASVNWPVSVGAKGVRYLIPEYWRARTSDDLDLLDAISRPDGSLAEMESRLGPYTDGSEPEVKQDEIRTRFALDIIAAHKPGLMTVHLSSLDGAEHESGPFSQESNDTLEALDGMIGRLMTAFLKNDPDGVVAIVSDHGFARTDYRVNLLVPFVEAGMLKVTPAKSPNGTPVVSSWDATVWLAGGMAAVMLRDPDDTALATRVKAMLTKLQADPQNGIARILDKPEIAKFGAFPNAFLLVELKPPYQMGNNLTGPLVTPAPSTGTHGYLPDRPEMRASFFVMGKGVMSGKPLGVVDMRQIAPTLAAILNVKMPPTPMSAMPVKMQ